jgi:hypothetical protein
MVDESQIEIHASQENLEICGVGGRALQNFALIACKTQILDKSFSKECLLHFILQPLLALEVQTFGPSYK